MSRTRRTKRLLVTDYAKDTREYYDVIKSFPVLYRGWEMDDVGFIVSDNGIERIALSTHGRFYFAKDHEIVNKIREYKKALAPLIKYIERGKVK